ncbi:DUF167 domain-containing protein [Sneathiella limimaris]|uniref:DUF167 domain-containing protein n=1 Tax=Sneathiella limimaris TaxID=1964213 RepID=UPI00146E6609|nr:DUF167 domain-containing protein [Sneathiella limimaris]
MEPPFEERAEGIRLFLRLQPNASANRIDGLYQGSDRNRLKLCVTAQPEKGKANKAAIKLLSKFLSCSPSSLEVIQGQTDRNKTVFVGGEVSSSLLKLQVWFSEQRDKVNN